MIHFGKHINFEWVQYKPALTSRGQKFPSLTPLFAFPSLFRLEKSRLINTFLALYRASYSAADD